jgi:hypothetical protein
MRQAPDHPSSGVARRLSISVAPANQLAERVTDEPVTLILKFFVHDLAGEVATLESAHHREEVTLLTWLMAHGSWLMAMAGP